MKKVKFFVAIPILVGRKSRKGLLSPQSGRSKLAANLEISLITWVK